MRGILPGYAPFAIAPAHLAASETNYDRSVALVKYSLYRLVLAAICSYVLWLLGFHIYLAIALGVIIAAMLSYILLPKARTAAASQVAHLSPKRRAPSEVAQGEAEEDALLDAAEHRGDDSQVN